MSLFSFGIVPAVLDSFCKAVGRGPLVELTVKSSCFV